MVVARAARRRSHEAYVVVAILAVLAVVAVPRYSESRRQALVGEADGLLQDLKVAAWQHYQEHASWVDVPTRVPLVAPNVLGYTVPAGACWEVGVTRAAPDQIVLHAQPNATGRPICVLVPVSATVELTVNGDGSSSRAQTGL